MDIESIYTDTKEEAIDFLLSYLCKYNISYVIVEDEVHFLDKIYRFYDNNDNNLENALEKIYIAVNEFLVSKRLSIDDDLIQFAIAEGMADNKYPIPNHNSNKKKLIKMQNRINNLKLKNSKK